MECKKTQNSANCTCTATDCERRGVCCECLAAHLSSQTLPRCCFPAEAELAADRSFAGFAKAWNL